MEDSQLKIAFRYAQKAQLLHQQGNQAEAVKYYRQFLKIDPKNPVALSNMGVALFELGKLNESSKAYRQALKIDSEIPGVLANLGNVLCSLDKLDEAVTCYRKAISLDPSNFIFYQGLGSALEKKGDLEGALACCQKVLVMDPSNTQILADVFLMLRNLCWWEEAEDLTSTLDQLNLDTPFTSVFRCDDPSKNFEVAKKWSQQIIGRISDEKIFSHARKHEGYKGKIRIGYLSSDFLNHPTAHLMLSLFKLHDRKQFEVFVYSYGRDDGSSYRTQISKDCDRFIDLEGVNDFEAAELIFKDRIDILVDLKGYTLNNRLEICALRPSPIQVAYLGFPGTTGSSFFDYAIVDEISVPRDQAPFYSEKLAFLPHCYQVNDYRQKISKTIFRRSDFGLPEKSIVFSSFNQTYKIEPGVFSVWMEILKAVPGSVLWQLKSNVYVEKKLNKEAEKRGVDPERIVFASKIPKAEHLARLALADLGLDTLIYNGHTTTSDALWAGVPVVTLQGKHFASRVSSSILTAVGLPELITHSLAEYKKLALRLAKNPKQLKEMKGRLSYNRAVKPLFDTPRFCRNLEKAYLRMWKIYQKGQKSQQIYV